MAEACSASSARAWADRVLASEQQLGLAADGVAHVLELEPVGVLPRELDPLDAVAAAHLDHRHIAVPRIVQEERAFAADRLELVAVRHRGPAVEGREHVVREAQRPGEHPVGARRPEPGLAVDVLGLAAEEARAADVVTADVHQRAALDIGAQADVVLVVERVAERRADEPQLADRALVDELLRTLRLRVVAVHERLAQQAAGALGRVERRLDLVGVARHRLLAEHVLARLERLDRPLAVHRVRQGDVDRLDLVVGEQRLVRAVGAWDLPFLRVRVGARLVAARDCDEVDRPETRARRGSPSG